MMTMDIKMSKCLIISDTVTTNNIRDYLFDRIKPLSKYLFVKCRRSVISLLISSKYTQKYTHLLPQRQVILLNTASKTELHKSSQKHEKKAITYENTRSSDTIAVNTLPLDEIK